MFSKGFRRGASKLVVTLLMVVVLRKRIRSVLSRWLVSRLYRTASDQSRTEAEVVGIKAEIDRLVASEAREDVHLYTTLLLKCGSYKLEAEGERLHETVYSRWRQRPERLLLNCLVEMYGRCGRLERARTVFASINNPNVFSWTIVIAAHSQNGHYREALVLFRRMEHEGVKPNNVTFVNVVAACAGLQDFYVCKRMHARVVEAGYDSNLVVITALVTMYGRCGNLNDARLAFKGIAEKDLVSWNALLAAYAQQGEYDGCLGLYQEMVFERNLQPDEMTYMSVVDSCAGLGDIKQSRQVHLRIIEDGLDSDLLLKSALVDMYGKCGSVEESKEIFDRMEWREASTWNALISAVSQQGDSSTACRFLQNMDLEGVKTTDITFISLLAGFSAKGSLRAGRWLHQRIVASGFFTHVMVATSLVTMYGRCGVAGEARAVFDSMKVKSLVTFNAMIGAYAELCYVRETLELFWTMDQLGVVPDSVTLLSVLFSCSHGGLLHEGVVNFRSMLIDRDLKADLEHYRCLVDLLARAGWLCEAEEVIQEKFREDDLASRLSLLSACILQADDARGWRCAEIIGELHSFESDFI